MIGGPGRSGLVSEGLSLNLKPVFEIMVERSPGSVGEGPRDGAAGEILGSLFHPQALCSRYRYRYRM